MAEELSKQNTVKENCERLLTLLKQKELSDIEQAELRTMVTDSPELLCQKDFAAGLGLCDLNSAYKNGGDINDMVYQSAKAQQDLKPILDRLKTLTVQEKGGKEKNAAAFVLDNTPLENGELVGTQLVKNMHFLGTAKKDKGHKFYADDSKNVAARNALSSHLGQMSNLYKELYEKPDGYCANPVRTNLSGQKVGDLMALYNTGREGQVGEMPKTIDKLKDSPLMSNPPLENVEKRRDALVVDMLENKTKISHNQTLTPEQLKEGAYRGTLTPEQMDAFNKQKKEVPAERLDGDRHKPNDDVKGEKFKEEDIVKYMYEEWFLALMSWGFDKAEGLMLAALSRAVSSYKEKSAVAEVNVNPELKAVKDKVDVLQKSRNELETQIKEDTAKKADKYDKLYTDLGAYIRTEGTKDPTKREDLEKRCGKDFMRRLDAASDQKEFLRISQKDVALSLDVAQATARASLILTEIEMVDQLMKDKNAGKVNGQFKSDADFQAELRDRALKRQETMQTALVNLVEHSRLMAEASFMPAGKLKRKMIVQEKIYDSFDQLMDYAGSDKAKKDKLKDQKNNFKELYQKLSNDNAAQTELVCQTYAALRANIYMSEVIQEAQETQRLQAKDYAADKFDINNKKPSKETAHFVKDIDDLLKNTVRQTSEGESIFQEDKYDQKVETRMGLLDAAIEDNTPTALTRAADIIDQGLSRISSSREITKKRKEQVKEAKHWQRSVETGDKRMAFAYNMGMPTLKMPKPAINVSETKGRE